MLKWTHPATSDLVLDRLNKILGVNDKGEVTLGWTPGIFESLAELLAQQSSSATGEVTIIRHDLKDAATPYNADK